MNQTGASAAMRELADQLIAFEAAQKNVLEIDRNATCRVCEKMRRPMIILTGTAGYSSLLRRSLALARQEAHVLGAISVQPDGTLSGLEGDAVEAIPILVAYLLGLLSTFIGESLTMRLLQDIWPDIVFTGQAADWKESK